MDLKLFLGFPSDPLFKESLKKANPYLVTLFIGKEEYLHSITFQGNEFLGKYLPPYPSYEQIEDIEKHMISLLQRLVPTYPFSKNPPLLMTLSEDHGF